MPKKSLRRLNQQLQSLKTDGYCILADVLDAAEVKAARRALIYAAVESKRRGVPTYVQGLDPNEENVRVFNLLDLDPIFRKLILQPQAIALVQALIGEHFLISNFTANIAMPGSESMAIHADQAIVIPEPWLQPWAINIIWCLDDVYPDNGATLYLPGSHHVARTSELPRDMKSAMVPFEASAGSMIAMDGRLWHTSGENVTRDQERALLFGYYTAGFIRPQVNWNASLSAHTLDTLDARLFDFLGLGATANLRQSSVILDSEDR